MRFVVLNEHQSRSQLRHSTFSWQLVLGLSLLGFSRLSSQTFFQLTDMGENVGPRLTRVISQARVHRALFGRIGTKVSFINRGVVFQFASDPVWGRVTVGRWDQWIHAYTNAGGPGGGFGEIYGLDVSARRNLYVADRSKARVLVTAFDTVSGTLSSPRNWPGSVFKRPVDVEWDGQTTPLTTDYLYVLDDSLNAVTYWDVNSAVPGALKWTFGSTGAGTGQFYHPSGICVGKTAGSTGGTQFTTTFYVADRGNHRLVRLSRGSSSASWVGTTTIAGWDPTDCAVDHFGNVYVVDQSNNHIYKFTYALSLLATYGTYGRGSNNVNTLSYPHAISVPCGLKVVNSQTVWYCEGRVVTAEQWRDSSGAVEHYLGIDGAITAQPQTDPTGSAWFSYSTTDHGTHSVSVLDQSGNYVRTTNYVGLIPPGVRNEYWDGLKDDGTPAPSGTYAFQVLATSAYGCSGQSWCRKGLATQWFYHQQGTGCGGGPCSPPAGDGSNEPTVLYLRQAVMAMPQSLARVSGPALSASRVPQSSPGAAAPGSLTSLVRQYGIRGLSFSVTRAASLTPVSIKVYSLAGRLVRVLVNEHLQPGYYEIGWDGLDESSRAVPSGVYLVQMSVGSFHAMDRLILR